LVRVLIEHNAEREAASNVLARPLSIGAALAAINRSWGSDGGCNRAVLPGRYSPEAFSVSGLKLSFGIFGFSALQMM
jgi:hypothetical protein